MVNISRMVKERLQDFKESRAQSYAAKRIIRKRARAAYWREREAAAKEEVKIEAKNDARPFFKRVAERIDKNRRARGVQPVQGMKASKGGVKTAFGATGGYDAYAVPKSDTYEFKPRGGNNPYEVKKVL